MVNPLIQFRVSPELRQKIEARTKELGFDEIGDYLKQVARREIADGEGKSLNIVAEQAAVCGGTIVNHAARKGKRAR